MLRGLGKEYTPLLAEASRGDAESKIKSGVTKTSAPVLYYPTAILSFSLPFGEPSLESVESILVTGGAGYIGSHTAHQLVEANYRVVVLDNLYSGHPWAVPAGAEFVQGDITDRDLLSQLLRRHAITAVLHFAGHIVVPESVQNPNKYYRNNVLGSLNLIETCLAEGVARLVFSSSAAVYGEPEFSHPNARIVETTVPKPINPYGRSKLITEWCLQDAAAAHPEFEFAALRYFNVAGARADGKLGQATPEATHLIKVACQAACGSRAGISLFGDDYPTADGTCVRDYIHVEDLARAHLCALDYLTKQQQSVTVNCGYGRGYSVKEVLACVAKVSGVDFSVTPAPRRAGDPASLVADNARIRELFDWQPRHADLTTICASAYQWEKTQTARAK